MLIIFDLDDTLIDTSGFVTPFKLKLALDRMIEAGLKADPFFEAYFNLKQIDSASESTRETLAAFLEMYKAPPAFYDIAMKAFVEPLPEGFLIKPWKQTVQILEELKKEHLLAIVTMGNHHFQMEKLKKAGLEPSLFCKIDVAQISNKKPHYSSLIEEMQMPPREVIVCGDRIKNDLSPAKELGATTVHLLKGRGKNSKGPKEDVDFTIHELEEIKEIIAEKVL